MSLEFGRPKTSAQAWLRIPDRSHPDYAIDDGSYEHCAHFKEFVLGFYISYASGKADDLTLEQRMDPMVTEDLRFLFQINSFYRNLNTSFTADWAHLHGKDSNPWALVLPRGDSNYRWWQIDTLEPDTRFGNHRLYSIEMNNRYNLKKTVRRFDENSEFELVFAKEGEIEILKRELAGADCFRH